MYHFRMINIILFVLICISSCEEGGASYLINALNVEIEAVYYFDYTATGGKAGSRTMFIPAGAKAEIEICNYPSQITRLVLKTNSFIFYDKTTVLLTNDFTTYIKDNGSCAIGEDISEFVISTNI